MESILWVIAYFGLGVISSIICLLHDARCENPLTADEKMLFVSVCLMIWPVILFSLSVVICFTYISTKIIKYTDKLSKRFKIDNKGINND